MQPADEEIRLEKVFLPYYAEMRDQVLSSGGRFVHYCSAYAAHSIITNESMWLRQASAMNDFREIEHGRECLRHAEGSGVLGRLGDALSLAYPGIWREIEERMNKIMPALRTQTYLSCFSRHDDDEDDLGRLSMWRAYGGDNAVAIVVKSAPFFLKTNSLRAFSSPVAYYNHIEFSGYLDGVANSVREEAEFLVSVGRERIFNAVVGMLMFGILSTKHPGFREE